MHNPISSFSLYSQVNAIWLVGIIVDAGHRQYHHKHAQRNGGKDLNNVLCSVLHYFILLFRTVEK